MSTGYTSEGREEFYASGKFDMLAPFIVHLATLSDTAGDITDALTPEQINDFCVKCSKIIGMLYVMVHDARTDIANLKEAAQHGKH